MTSLDVHSHALWPGESPSPCDPQPDNRRDSCTSLSRTGYPATPRWQVARPRGASGPSWSNTGNLYTTWTDGAITDSGTGRQTGSMSNGGAGFFKPINNGSWVMQGQARVIGMSREEKTAPFDPAKPCCDGKTCQAEATSPSISGPCPLQLVNVSTFRCSALPYQGRYPSGGLYYKGVWYVGTYTLAEDVGNIQYPCGNWCVMGPFVGFRHSVDDGVTWEEPRFEMAKDFESYQARQNLFGERGPVCTGSMNHTDASLQWRNPNGNGGWTCLGKWQGKVKFGAPHVVDLGQELEYSGKASKDGVKRAYVVGHGADKEEQPHSWMQGSQVYMARTKEEVSPTVMSSGSSWEFFAGYHSDGETAIWKDAVADAKPLYTWENRTGVVTLTYIPKMDKFIMVVSTPSWSDGIKSTVGPFDTYFLESSAITGPFKLVSYLEAFGPEAYFVNIPSFTLQPKGGPESKGDGMLSYSANFAYQLQQVPVTPLQAGYHWSLLPFRFKLAEEGKNASASARGPEN